MITNVSKDQTRVVVYVEGANSLMEAHDAAVALVKANAEKEVASYASADSVDDNGVLHFWMTGVYAVE